MTEAFPQNGVYKTSPYGLQSDEALLVNYLMGRTLSAFKKVAEERSVPSAPLCAIWQNGKLIIGGDGYFRWGDTAVYEGDKRFVLAEPFFDYYFALADSLFVGKDNNFKPIVFEALSENDVVETSIDSSGTVYDSTFFVYPVFEMGFAKRYGEPVLVLPSQALSSITLRINRKVGDDGSGNGKIEVFASIGDEYRYMGSFTYSTAPATFTVSFVDQSADIYKTQRELVYEELAPFAVAQPRSNETIKGIKSIGTRLFLWTDKGLYISNEGDPFHFGELVNAPITPEAGTGGYLPIVGVMAPMPFGAHYLVFTNELVYRVYEITSGVWGATKIEYATAKGGVISKGSFTSWKRDSLFYEVRGDEIRVWGNKFGNLPVKEFSGSSEVALFMTQSQVFYQINGSITEWVVPSGQIPSVITTKDGLPAIVVYDGNGVATMYETAQQENLNDFAKPSRQVALFSLPNYACIDSIWVYLVASFEKMAIRIRVFIDGSDTPSYDRIHLIKNGNNRVWLKRIRGKRFVVVVDGLRSTPPVPRNSFGGFYPTDAILPSEIEAEFANMRQGDGDYQLNLMVEFDLFERQRGGVE